MKKAVFPGSFDPITLGHVDILKRAIPMFDKIVIAIGINDSKKYYFSLEQRISFLEAIFKDEPSVTIKTYSGLTYDFCKQENADFILRGLRNPADFEFEKAIAQTNRKLSGIDTVFLLTSTDTAFISSSIVRDVLKHGGDVSALVSKEIADSLY
ncbi:pantetheine-phosphate adenylyltransferase [Flavobacteriaceae bacterium]|nr:pantetheine-phosphate adenylyltransferase [Flavobacteriaceae bacterium]